MKRSEVVHFKALGDNFNQGLFDNRTCLIHDRDPLFIAENVQKTLETSGVKSIKTAPCSPNQNSFAEAFVARIRDEMFNKVIFTSKEQLDYAIKYYQEYYNPSSYCRLSLCA